MKQLLLTFGLFCAVTLCGIAHADAQTDFYNQGDSIIVQNNTTVYVNGNFQSIYTRNKGTIEATGNFVNSGRYISLTTDTVQLDGAAVNNNFQFGSDTLGTLIVNKPGFRLIVQGQPTVSENLVFLGGILKTDNSVTDLLTLYNAAPVVGAGPTAFVEGPLQWNKTATSYIFPIGKNGNYRPLTLAPSANTSRNLQAVVVEGNPNAVAAAGQHFGKLSKVRYWQLNQLGGVLAANTPVTVGYGTNDSINTTYSRLGISDIVAGPYAPLLTPSVVGGTVSGNLSTGIAAGLHYLILGKGIVSPINLTSLPTPLATVGDTVRLNLGGGDLGDTYTYQAFTGGSWNTIGGGVDQTHFTADTIFNPTPYRIIGSFAGFQNDTSNIDTVKLKAYLALKLKAFLQGPYSLATGTMSNAPSHGSITLGHFQGTLWNMYHSLAHANFDSTSIPANTVDAVNIKLYSAYSAGSPAAADSAWAWLQSDGSLIEFRSSSPAHPQIYFSNVAGSSYYVVIHQRNHLDMGTKNPMTLAMTPTTVDMTKPNNIYSITGDQRGGYLDQARNVMALFSGNAANLLGETIHYVSAYDYYRVYLKGKIATPGFIMEDINLDGVVNSTDYTSVQINQNNLYRALVP